MFTGRTSLDAVLAIAAWLGLRADVAVAPAGGFPFAIFVRTGVPYWVDGVERERGTRVDDAFEWKNLYRDDKYAVVREPMKTELLRPLSASA